MMEKRKIIFGDYDTALDGPWTLGPWTLSEPEYQSNLVEVPGRQKGPLDLSTVLTGEVAYGSRELTVHLECSEGTRLDRLEQIAVMTNQLDGRQVKIILPDDPDHYLVGRVKVRKEYNDPVHAAVNVTATCEPWRYRSVEVCRTLVASAAEQVVALSNTGRLTVTPTATVTGGSVKLTRGEDVWELDEGTYRLPDLRLETGNTALTYSGTGTVAITYREAVL